MMFWHNLLIKLRKWGKRFLNFIFAFSAFFVIYSYIPNSEFKPYCRYGHVKFDGDLSEEFIEGFKNGLDISIDSDRNNTFDWDGWYIFINNKFYVSYHDLQDTALIDSFEKSVLSLASLSYNFIGPPDLDEAVGQKLYDKYRMLFRGNGSFSEREQAWCDLVKYSALKRERITDPQIYFNY